MPERLPIVDQERLVRRVKEEVERAGDFKIQIKLDLTAVFALCGNLQLALRHPGNTGPCSQVARHMIDDLRAGLSDRGFTAHAEMIALGDDPANDYEPSEPEVDPRNAMFRSGGTV